MFRCPLSPLTAAAVVVVAAVLSGCEAQTPAQTPASAPAQNPGPNNAPAAPTASEAGSPWALQISSAGAALILAGSDGEEVLRMTCRRGPSAFTVTSPRLKRIASEERLTLGADDELVTLVVPQVGVSASAPVEGEAPYPEAFLAALSGASQVAAAYGSQNVGPAPGPGGALGRRFAEACREVVHGARVSDPAAGG